MAVAKTPIAPRAYYNQSRLSNLSTENISEPV